MINPVHWACSKYGLLAKRDVKMAGYLPLARSVNTPKKTWPILNGITTLLAITVPKKLSFLLRRITLSYASAPPIRRVSFFIFVR